MIENGIARLHRAQSQLLGYDMHQNHRSWYTGLIINGGHNLIFVLYLAFFYRPANLDRLVLQEYFLLGGHAWINDYQVLVTVVFVSRDIELIAALWQFCREDTVFVGNALGYQRQCRRVTQYHLSTSHMWLIIGVVGKFIRHINVQNAFLL